MKCDFADCTNQAHWRCRKLFGKGGFLFTCDEHKPDASKRTSETVKKLPMFYEITPIISLLDACRAVLDGRFTVLDPDVHAELLAFVRAAVEEAKRASDS